MAKYGGDGARTIADPTAPIVTRPLTGKDDGYGKDDPALHKARALLIPGGSLTRSKGPSAWFDLDPATGWPRSGLPVFAQSASGCRITDTNGRTYIDMLCALGAISIGYAAPANTGTQIYSLPSLSEGYAAEAVLTAVAPWAKQVRFTKTGSEATHAALMVARVATQRRAFARLRGSYHGWHTEWSTENDHARFFPVGASADGLHLTFTDCAAVFIEAPRWETCTREWLIGVAVAARKAGALLVFDEMIYGGRVALGGASEYFGVEPDLACYGKALGNGASIACVVGGEALRDHGTLVSGTYSGEAGALQSLAWTVRHYAEHDVVGTLWKRGRQLQRGLDAICAKYPDKVHVEGLPVHQRLVFKHEPFGKRFAEAMARRGVLWHPACANVMAAHTADDIEAVVCAAEDSLKGLLG